MLFEELKEGILVEKEAIEGLEEKQTVAKRLYEEVVEQWRAQYQVSVLSKQQAQLEENQVTIDALKKENKEFKDQVKAKDSTIRELRFEITLSRPAREIGLNILRRRQEIQKP
jgi:aminopeptidase N